MSHAALAILSCLLIQTPLEAQDPFDAILALYKTFGEKGEPGSDTWRSRMRRLHGWLHESRVQLQTLIQTLKKEHLQGALDDTLQPAEA